MKNKLILSLLLSSLACTFFACDDDEPDPTPSRPTNECSVAKCEGNTVYLCVDGRYKLSENCAYKCESGKCVTNEPILPGQTCANGEKRCNGDIPQTCNVSGLWVSGDKCLEGQKCENGVCTGTPVVQPEPSKCTNGEQKCEGNKAMVCSGGAFTVNEECAYKCENGVCVDAPVEETLCTGKADGCYCSSALAGANSFCCKGEKVSGEQQCKDSTSFCMADGDAPKCVGCRNSNDCDAATPVCSANVCEAKNAEWCKGKADGYYCRTEEGVDTGFGCENGQIVQDGWFPPTECNDGNNRVCRASTQGFECVECLGDNDCESGKVCDTRNNTCVIPGDAKYSCPNASFVGSTCYTDPNYFEYVVACDLGNEKSRSKCADDPNGKVCIKDGDDYAFCGCKKDTDCNGYKCQSGNFCKSSCASDSDCAKDYSCQSKKCVKAAEPECTKDSDCKSGFECKDQVCVEKAAEPECTKDSDCKSGFECKNQVCVEKTPAGGSKTYKETFAGITSTNKTSYVDGSFTGTDSGISWTFKSGRIGLDKYEIDGDGIMFYQSSKKAGSLETTLTDGVASLKLNARKAFTGTGDRFVSVSANGDKKCEFKLEAKDDVQTMPSCDINLKGEVILLIEQTGAQTTIDNIEWTNNK